MSIDTSLKKRRGLARTRNVLTRAERIVKLQEQERFNPEENSPFGLPKVRVQRLIVKKAKKKAAPEDEKGKKKKK